MGGPNRAEGTFYVFRTFMSQNDLFNLKHYGSYLSWRGKRHNHFVQSRLDKAQSNSEWTDIFPSCRSQYLKYEGSHNRPLISFIDTKIRKCHIIFKTYGSPTLISKWRRNYLSVKEIFVLRARNSMRTAGRRLRTLKNYLTQPCPTRFPMSQLSTT